MIAFALPQTVILQDHVAKLGLKVVRWMRFSDWLGEKAVTVKTEQWPVLEAFKKYSWDGVLRQNNEAKRNTNSRWVSRQMAVRQQKCSITNRKKGDRAKAVALSRALGPIWTQELANSPHTSYLQAFLFPLCESWGNFKGKLVQIVCTSTFNKPVVVCCCADLIRLALDGRRLSSSTSP